MWTLAQQTLTWSMNRMEFESDWRILKEELWWANQMVHCSSDLPEKNNRKTNIYGIKETLNYVRRRCPCTRHLNDWIPSSVMLPTTETGRLFHRGTAVWMKLLSKQRVLAAGKERACSGNETLKWVAQRLEYGGGSKADSSAGQWRV